MNHKAKKKASINNEAKHRTVQGVLVGSLAPAATSPSPTSPVPSACVAEGAALCQTKGISAATGRKSSCETVD